jgi:tripartite-type tricarboxylate transporter receptor subunit TctC
MQTFHRCKSIPVLAICLALAVTPTVSGAQSALPSGKTTSGPAQAFPSKPIRLVVSTLPASQPDMLARMIAQKMSENWGRPVIMENRPGAGGILAASTVAKATPDGHTVLYSLPNFSITPALQSNVPYTLKDFQAITQIGYSTNVLVASPAIGVKTVHDLVALAKAQPGKLILASSATGSASHLTGARFNYITGIKVVTVAFKGGPDATIEVLAGRAQYHVGTMGVVLPFVKEGKLVALGLTTPQRSTVLPDVPSLSETLPEFKRPETSHNVLAPAGTPRAIVNQINREIARILDLPDVKERMQGISFVGAPTTPEECTKILREQMDTLGKLVADAGLRPK